MNNQSIIDLITPMHWPFDDWMKRESAVVLLRGESTTSKPFKYICGVWIYGDTYANKRYNNFGYISCIFGKFSKLLVIPALHYVEPSSYVTIFKYMKRVGVTVYSRGVSAFNGTAVERRIRATHDVPLVYKMYTTTTNYVRSIIQNSDCAVCRGLTCKKK